MKCFFAVVIVFLVLVGCAPAPIATPVPPTSTLTPIPPSATPTEIPTETAIITPTSTPDVDYVAGCLEILPEIPTDDTLTGVIVLGTYDDTPPYTSYLLNIKTKEKIPLLGRVDENIGSYSVSPDGKWLAYYSYSQKEDHTARLVIMGSNGRPIKDRLVSTLNWMGMIGWVNNQQLLFEKYDSEKIFKSPLTTIVYNPFSTEQYEISPSLPGIQQNLPQWPDWDEYKYTEIVPSPALSFIVYQANDGKSVLWDRESEKEIGFFLNDEHYYLEKPVWSPDGSLFLKDNIIPQHATSMKSPWNTELFSMNLAGNVNQLTNFSSQLSNTSIFDYTWSPNMGYVAFWLRSEPSTIRNSTGTGHSLAILNMKSKKVIDFCIESIDVVTISGGGTLIGPFENPALWSPDSQKLLVFVSNGKDKGMTILVNLEKNYAAKIAEDMLPMGWLTNEP